MLIRDMSRSLAEHGKTLLLADLTSQILVDWLAILEAGDRRDTCFANVDMAIEHCENQLITEVGSRGPRYGN